MPKAPPSGRRPPSPACAGEGIEGRPPATLARPEGRARSRPAGEGIDSAPPAQRGELSRSDRGGASASLPPLAGEAPRRGEGGGCCGRGASARWRQKRPLPASGHLPPPVRGKGLKGGLRLPSPGLSAVLDPALRGK